MVATPGEAWVEFAPAAVARAGSATAVARARSATGGQP